MFFMNLTATIAAIDEEIARLTKARELLSPVASPAKPGRPKGKRKTLSAAARARISAAQKARWAKLKKEKKHAL
jgi:hypothetical protein